MILYFRLLSALLVTGFLSIAHAQNWTMIPIHNFLGSPSDGSAPNALIGGDGVLYGTSQFGGALNAGTAFSLTPPTAVGQPWTETVIYEFTPADGGIEPYSLVRGSGGVLYGYAEGGTTHAGVVFSLTPPASPGSAWTYESVFNFNGGSYRGSPLGALAIGQGDVLYGTTYYGGNANEGTVFSLTPPSAAGGAWTPALLHNFSTETGGGNPIAGVEIGKSGVLYGVASTISAGIVYSLTPRAGSWEFSVLYNFTGGADGGRLSAAVSLGEGGVLYGVTGTGGANGGGVVFSLSPPAVSGEPWTEAVIYSFPPHVVDAPSPGSSLAVGATGVLYGCTTGQSSSNNGSVFSWTPPAVPGDAWTTALLYTFPAGRVAPSPWSLIVSGNGLLYGPAYAQSKDVGIIFQLKP